MAVHDLVCAGALPGSVVADPVFLKAIGSHLVASHTAADLVTPFAVDSLSRGARRQLVECGVEGEPGFAKRCLAFACLRRAYDAGWQMRQAAAVLMLVSMLSAGAGTRIPFDAVICIVTLVERLGALRFFLEHGNGDRRSVDAPPFFRRRHSLYTMSSAFLGKPGKIGTGKFDKERLVPARGVGRLVRANCSAVAGGQLEIGLGEIRHEKPRIGAAFGGPDFEAARFCLRHETVLF